MSAHSHSQKRNENSTAVIRTCWHRIALNPDPETEDVVETDYWMQIAHGSGFCFDYTFESVGTYDLRFKASSSK